MKTAILGGSFNPVHNGHLALAEDVLKLGYKRVLFIPAARSPHKNNISGASDKDRLQMLNLALEGFSAGGIWDGEILRGGISYSIDTVRELLDSNTITSRIGLIIGDDLVKGFLSWKNSKELVSIVDIILARRSENITEDFPYPCTRLDNQLWPFSSTEIREKIAGEEDIYSLLPPGVADYIHRKKLYANAAT